MNRILVIEDDHHVKDVIFEMLDAQNFKVIHAQDGHHGLKLARQEKPDLVLCDIMMPELDGYGVLSQLQDDPETVTIPFIFLTAKAAKSDLRTGMELGADDYLTKPFTIDELLGAINTRLTKKTSVDIYFSRKIEQLEVSYINQVQQTEEELNSLLYYNETTHLPNQVFLQKQFVQLLNSLESSYDRKTQSSLIIPVLYIKIDRLNRIEASLGEEGTKLAIKSVAKGLKTCMKTGKIVAHLCADEFAMILLPTKQKTAAGNVARLLQKQLNRPFFLNGIEVCIQTSIGIAFYPHHGHKLLKLLQNSRKAMKLARRQGINQYQIYNPTFSTYPADQLALESDLRYALEREELQLYYQPQVNLQTGHIFGAEALLRWQHPTKGSIPTRKFISLAEESGLIELISDWVLQTVCHQVGFWQTTNLSALTIAINLSAYHFNQPHLCQRLVEMLMNASCDPKSLEIDLAENILLRNPAVAIQHLGAFRAIGLKIAIDNFGTGYSSLGYLQRFPFDILKIDRCFVRNINKCRKNAAIVRAIITMAHQMNLKVIAEGVETNAELAFLRQQGCDRAQGYLFSRPLPAAEFEALARKGKCEMREEA